MDVMDQETISRIPSLLREYLKGMMVPDPAGHGNNHQKKYPAARRSPAIWHVLIPVFFLLALSLAGAVQAAAVATVSVTANPAVISPGGTSSIQIFVSDVRGGAGSDTREIIPLPGASVTLSTTAPGITFFPATGKTGSDGKFTSTLITAPSASGSISVHAVAQIPGDFYGEGTGTVTVRKPSVTYTTQPPVNEPLQPAVNQPPVAVIAVDRYAGDAPLTVQFDGRQSYDPDGSIAGYQWNYGDGASGDGYVATHQYTAPGTYVASLSVTDNNGLSANPATARITVQSAGAPGFRQGESCDDGNKCTTNDHYDSKGICVAGPVISCDDNNPDTADQCNPATGCVHARIQSDQRENPSAQPTAAPSQGASITMNVQAAEIQNPDIFGGMIQSLSRIIQNLIGWNTGPEEGVKVATKDLVPCSDAGGTQCPNGCRMLKTDPDNCGSCGNVCSPRAYADPVCNNGACGFSCIQNYADCNKYAPDGCEVNLVTDVNNCGTCSHYCPTDRVCLNKECQCANGRSDCNGVCFDLRQDSKNCGSCGKTCDYDRFCENGVCRCSYGTKDCGGKCINPSTDPSIECGGVCINPKTDSLNCGTCGKKCNSDQQCSNGQCIGPGGCFPADTLVATYDSFKPISMIQTGDVIPGYDQKMKQVINRTTTEILQHKNQSVLQLEFKNDSVICTPIQPFFTGTWTPASDLKAGDKVLCRDNHWEVLIKDPTPAGKRDVYNLHGSPNQSYYTSYYVGKTQLLVHNFKTK